jgi:hypothetical protein
MSFSFTQISYKQPQRRKEGTHGEHQRADCKSRGRNTTVAEQEEKTAQPEKERGTQDKDAPPCRAWGDTGKPVGTAGTVHKRADKRLA